ncbi:MAG TPA: glycosyltransferase family 39 protein [bacterium]|nr:glycosyltransferase family 39 protein [bacterium]
MLTGDRAVVTNRREVEVEAFARTTSLLKSIGEFIVLVLAVGVGLVGWRYYFDAGLILSYNDAMSHLDISRRVVDGLHPGLAQIGSVWLPLPHVLMLPFIWNDFFWHTGLAGSIVSHLAFIGGAILLFRLTTKVTNDIIAGILAALIFIINPNMIYMQAIPMTESLLLFLFIASTYSFVTWQKSQDFRYLALSALFIFLSTLTRYDGWMLLLQMGIIVLLVSYRAGKWKKLEGNIVLFGTLALFGVILWLVWNYLIFGDALYFANGPFSAKSQQMVFEREGRLFSKGNLPYSAYIYGLAVLKNNGVFVTALATLGLVAYFIRKRFSNDFLAATLLLSPFVFNVAALFFGHSIINLLEIPPHTLFNVRYGLMVLPAVAFFGSYLVAKQRFLQLLVVIALLIQTFFMVTQDGIITVMDGVYGASAQNAKETGEWIGKHTGSNGLILIAASSQDSLIFQSNLPMTRFIHEGTGDYWNSSLENPTKHAEYVAMHHGDLVYESLATNQAFLENYIKVYDGEFTDIYQRGNPEKTLTKDDLP